MISVLSPAKTLDFESTITHPHYTIPGQLDKSEILIKALQKKSITALRSLMDISKDLAELNKKRYVAWHTDFTQENARQAIIAFKGDVYIGLEVERFEPADFEYSQKALRILSGLHGLLKPLDLIQPYRLEMGVKLMVRRYENLYQFWSDYITQELINEVQNSESPYLVNLASNEYFKAIDQKKLPFPVITPVFKDFSNGQYKFLSFFAKKARGAMAAYIVHNKLTQPEDLKHFKGMDYAFNEELSSGNEFVFTRVKPK